MTCLEKERDRRYPSAAALCAALEQCADYGSWTQEHAQAWWALHAKKLQKGAPAETEDSARATIAIETKARVVPAGVTPAPQGP